GVGVVEQHPVTHLHLAHEVARLVVAHPGPGFGDHAGQVVDREVGGLGLHQPVALAGAHVMQGSARTYRIRYTPRPAARPRTRARSTPPAGTKTRPPPGAAAPAARRGTRRCG